MTEKQLAKSRQRLAAFTEETLAPLGRSERRHWGSVYMRGLLLDGERKSVGAMVPRLPEGNEQALQQFVSQSPWPWEPVWERLAAEARRQKGEAFWIVDDTSFPKQGTHSVGVARQYCGRAGQDRQLSGGDDRVAVGEGARLDAGRGPVSAEVSPLT